MAAFGFLTGGNRVLTPAILAKVDEPISEGTGLTALAAAAASLHEMYTSFVEAGFSESQALALVTAVVTSMGHNAP